MTTNYVLLAVFTTVRYVHILRGAAGDMKAIQSVVLIATNKRLSE